MASCRRCPLSPSGCRKLPDCSAAHPQPCTLLSEAPWGADRHAKNYYSKHGWLLQLRARRCPLHPPPLHPLHREAAPAHSAGGLAAGRV